MITPDMLSALADSILPLIQEVCESLQGKPEDSGGTKLWIFGGRKLSVSLQKRQWHHIISYFKVPDCLTAARAAEVRTAVVLDPEKKDYLERMLYSQRPHWRLCNVKFRKDGILLPIGASRQDFSVPNP